MQKSLGMFLALATLSAAHAQSADPASQGSSSTSPSSQPAPVVQAYPDGSAAQGAGPYAATPQNAPRAAGPYAASPNGAPPSGPYGAASNAAPPTARQVFDAEPSAGIFVRYDVNQGVKTESASGAATEIRVLDGRADVTVHHPADHSQVLVDLPRGQVALLKDGLYTFNASTNTVRVLHGEAEAFAGEKSSAKGTKVKEYQQLTLVSDAKLKTVDSYRFELTADLLPGGGDHGDGGGYGRGFYGGSPYYAGFYGYPAGYGFYPYGYGYPFGVGFGYGFGYGRGFGGFGGFRR